jgi:hypothetical protein
LPNQPLNAILISKEHKAHIKGLIQSTAFILFAKEPLTFAVNAAPKIVSNKIFLTLTRAEKL